MNYHLICSILIISFLTKDCNYSFKNKKKFRKLLKKIVLNEGYKIDNISIVFTSDKYLLKVNKKFLSKNYLTDIITFDYSKNKIINGELVISIDRIKENAIIFKNSFLNELYRVIIHGFLHLMRYNDLTKNEEKEIRLKENEYLNFINKKLNIY